MDGLLAQNVRHRKLKKQLSYSDKLASISAILHANVALSCVCVCVCLISWPKKISYIICL